MLGLDFNKVMLVEHDNDWILHYESESQPIKQALADLVIDIQHIGSTSVAGLKAKPIIDILVGLKSFDQIHEVIREMETLGYIYAHWAGIPGDYTFRKGETTTHLVHVVEYGKNNWNHNIQFRDTLRNNPVLAKQYEQLKEDLAEKYPDSREKYTEGKSKFIAEVLYK
jgi:GrpB-like predicted nucleotidyltransferase (UPF0157 family)